MEFGSKHLTYCLSIHQGDTWKENFNAIKQYTEKIKSLIIPNAPFGLGLRLSAQSANSLAINIDKFKRYLSKQDMYVFTINGFPYGDFYKTGLKTNVYKPDWGTEQRLNYTIKLVDILAELLPKGINGSISTLPLTYGKTLAQKTIKNIQSISKYLAEKHSKTDKKILLALEPEPDCYLENTRDTINFFELLKKEEAINIDYLGVCLDTSHFALQFESPLKALKTFIKNKINVPKIQLSAALRYKNKIKQDKTKQTVNKFAEPTYLHQTRVKFNNKILKYIDLPEAIKQNTKGELRIHFHVPLYQNNYEENLTSTIDTITAEFFKEITKLANVHLEVETYSFYVIPNNSTNILESIVKELKFVTSQL